MKKINKLLPILTALPISAIVPASGCVVKIDPVEPETEEIIINEWHADYCYGAITSGPLHLKTGVLYNFKVYFENCEVDPTGYYKYFDIDNNPDEYSYDAFVVIDTFTNIYLDDNRLQPNDDYELYEDEYGVSFTNDLAWVDVSRDSVLSGEISFSSVTIDPAYLILDFDDNE